MFLKICTCCLFALLIFSTISCKEKTSTDPPKNNITKFPIEGTNIKPTMSPDHKYIAYVNEDMNVGDEGESGSIWLYDIEKKTNIHLCKLELSIYFDTEPVWSNDSKLLYFSSECIIYSVNINNKKVDTVFHQDNKNIIIFAPSLSKDGHKIAFWTNTENNHDLTQSIWILNLSDGNVQKFPEVEFGAETEVLWGKPEWFGSDTKIAAAFFTPSKLYSDNSDLYILDVNNNKLSKTASRIDPYIRIIKDNIYCSRYYNQDNYLCVCNGRTFKFEKIIKIGKSNFEVLFENNSQIIVFDKNGILTEYENNSVHSMGITGENPKYSVPYLVFENKDGLYYFDFLSLFNNKLMRSN
jgi:hypothetical protein